MARPAASMVRWPSAPTRSSARLERGRAGRRPPAVRQPRHPGRRAARTRAPASRARRTRRMAAVIRAFSAAEARLLVTGERRFSPPSQRPPPGRDQPRGADPRMGASSGTGSRPTATRCADASTSAPACAMGGAGQEATLLACRRACRWRKAASSSPTMAMCSSTR